MAEGYFCLKISLSIIGAVLLGHPEMPTVLEEASSVVPPVTTAQEVREASISPHDMSNSNQVCRDGLLISETATSKLYRACYFWFFHLRRRSDMASLLALHHGKGSAFMQGAHLEEGSKADDEALQMVLKRLKALEQENDGPERRELLRKRKKQLKEILSHHKDGCAQAQLPVLQKRFEQEVQWASNPPCTMN